MIMAWNERGHDGLGTRSGHVLPFDEKKKHIKHIVCFDQIAGQGRSEEAGIKDRMNVIKARREI